MEPSVFRQNKNQENQQSPSGNSRKKKMRSRNDGVRNDEERRRHSRRSNRNEDYESNPSGSYLGSFCRSCCTFQHFCYLVQLINCCLLCGLIYLILREYPKLQALDEVDSLQKQLQKDEAEIAALKDQVQNKQEGQLNTIEESLKQEQRNNFLTLAGIFTLLTCLISMFHMTTHVHKLSQPKIQRKIIAILWMSPIYSVTSFLTLIFPPIEGWMAIVKDFYESYCIYVFLSFLIAVLGEGSRDKAVEVLAKHADHLDQPTKCLGCFYEPPPDTSDHAKANAVMTQCQIYCMQFTLLRPLTTIIRVFVLQRDKDDEDESNDESDTFGDNTFQSGDSFDSTNDSSQSRSNNTSNSGFEGDETDLGEASNGLSDNASSGTNTTIDNDNDNAGTRMLRRNLQSEGEETLVPSNLLEIINNPPIVEFPSLAPVGVGDDPIPLPTFPSDGIPDDIDTPGPPTFNEIDPLAPSFSPIASDTLPTFSNNTGLGGLLDSNNTGGFSPNMSPTMAPTDSGVMSTDLVDQTKAYFRSPGFACAMVVNVSIFFAFSGLLKLYHAVRDDLIWCRPFPKFLTIKAVVFLTFWQGLAITIYVILTADPSEQKDLMLQAHKYQNLLICVEMLLVAISQWCVFPSVEWEPNYEPRQMQTPGLGIKDFVSDVGQIARSSRKGRRRKKRGGGGSKSGLYHLPGFASIVSSQFDGFGGPGSNTRSDSSFDDEDFEDSSRDESFDSRLDDQGNIIIEGTQDGSSPYNTNRERIQSDDSGGYSVENELSDNDLELL